MEECDVFGEKSILPLIYYDLEDQKCKCIRSEFTQISRVCKTEDDIIKFIESINFLFDLGIKYN